MAAAAAGNDGAGLPLAIVTGATGYIAAHVVRMLLDGGFRVRGTVRSTTSAKCDPLRALPGAAERLQLVEADLMRDDGWDAAMAGAHVVFHVASPYFMDKPKDVEKELVGPARDGTERVVRAVFAVPTVRRLIVTSSVAAIQFGRRMDFKVWSEEDWTVLPGKPTTPPYQISKTLAERRLWELVDELERNDPARAATLQVCAVNPGGVYGPAINQAQSAQSVRLVAQVMNGEVPMIPDLEFGAVDVRDVAKAHLRAAVVPQVHRRRIMAVTDGTHMREFMAAARAEFGEQGYSLPTSPMPHWLVSFMSCFSADAASLAMLQGQKAEYDTTPLHQVLGMAQADLVPMGESFVATAYSAISLGLVKAKSAAVGEEAARRAGELPAYDPTGQRAEDFAAAVGL